MDLSLPFCAADEQLQPVWMNSEEEHPTGLEDNSQITPIRGSEEQFRMPARPGKGSS